MSSLPFAPSRETNDGFFAASRARIPVFRASVALRLILKAILAHNAEGLGDVGIDEVVLKARIQTELKRFLRRRTNRRPLVLPVILEI